MSAPLVLLSGILGAAAVWGSWRIKNRVKEYFALLLFLQGVVIGVFVSLDLLLFFIFWEAELIPMYFLISIWGSGRAHYSAAKFVIFTLFAGALLIIGILAIYLSQGINSFTMVSIPELNLQGIPELMTGANFLIPVSVIFWLFFISFAQVIVFFYTIPRAEMGSRSFVFTFPMWKAILRVCLQAARSHLGNSRT